MSSETNSIHVHNQAAKFPFCNSRRPLFGEVRQQSVGCPAFVPVASQDIRMMGEFLVTVISLTLRNEL
jgi:hypothetical protein